MNLTALATFLLDLTMWATHVDFRQSDGSYAILVVETVTYLDAGPHSCGVSAHWSAGSNLAMGRRTAELAR